MTWDWARQVLHLISDPAFINVLLAQTLKALLHFMLKNPTEPILVVCPDARVASQWAGEIKKFMRHVNVIICTQSQVSYTNKIDCCIYSNPLYTDN